MEAIASKETEKIENVAAAATTPSDEDYHLTLQASEDFEKGSYDKCLETLKQLEKISSASPNTLRHNRALAEFYKTECKEYEKLLHALNELDGEEVSKVTMQLLLLIRISF